MIIRTYTHSNNFRYEHWNGSLIGNTISTQLIFYRQLSDAFARRGIDGITEFSHERRHTRLSDAGLWRVAVDQIHIRLIGSLIDPGDRIIRKIGLVDHTFGSGDFAGLGDARAEHCCALELGVCDLWVYNQSGVHGRIHARDLDLALIVHFDFHNRRYIGQEAPMRGDTQSRSLAELAFSPPGFLRNHFRNLAQTPGLPRIGSERRPIVRVIHILEIYRPGGTNQFEQVFERIPAGTMS